MKVNFLCIGKTTFPFIEEGVALYRDRIKHYCTFSVTTIAALKGASSLSREQIKIKEGELILKHLASFKKKPYIILLDENGTHFSSEAWSAHLQKLANSSDRELCFIIGGAYGFSEPVYKAADEKLSLSKMTFSHQIVRLIFMEQLYRTFTIMNNEPYHHQ